MKKRDIKNLIKGLVLFWILFLFNANVFAVRDSTCSYPASLDTDGDCSDRAVECWDLTDGVETVYDDHTDTWTCAIQALEAKVGINSSTPLADRCLCSTATGESDWSADPTFDSVTTNPSSSPSISFSDSDDAAGTATIMANSSGGVNDIIASYGVEDSGGENQTYMELDGVTETVDFLQPITGTSGTFTGTLTGLLSVEADSNGETVLTAECRGSMWENTGANTYVLPGAAKGLNCCFMAIDANILTIDPADGTDTIYLNGATVGPGDTIESPGDVGDFICLYASDTTIWRTVGQSGTWVDSNP